jgi:hypothetical protein
MLTFDQYDLEEAKFPSLSGIAFSQAYQETLNAGLSVYVSIEGFIYEITPEGKRRKIKDIDDPIPANPGTKISLK